MTSVRLCSAGRYFIRIAPLVAIFRKFRNFGRVCENCVSFVSKMNGMMEDILLYGVLGLVVLVFRITMMVDCERFEEIKMSQVVNRIARVFLRVRRLRVDVGYFLLAMCSFRLIFAQLVIPVVNILCQLLHSENYYVCRLANTQELYLVGSICILILAAYVFERRLMRRIMADFHEEE